MFNISDSKPCCRRSAPPTLPPARSLSVLEFMKPSHHPDSALRTLHPAVHWLPIALVVLALAASSVQATVLFWSANGTTVGGTGTWDTGNHWGSSTSGPFSPWNNANSDTADFSASGSSFGAVTVTTPITLNGTLQMETTPGTWPDWSLNGGSAAVVTFGPSSTLQVNGTYTMNNYYAGTITKAGAAQCTFNNANGSVTKFVFNAGVVAFANPSRFWVGANSATFLTFNGGTVSFNTTTAWTMGKSITVNSGGGTIAPSSATITVTQDQPIAWNSGNLTVNTSPLVLSSASSSGTGTLTANTATTLNAANVFGGSGIVLAGTGTVTFNNNSQTVKTVSRSGALALGSATLTIQNPAGETASGVISGTGGKIVKNGNGAWTLANSGNSYTGTTTVNAGTLAINANNSLPSATTVNLAGGILNMNSVNATVTGLQFGGIVTAKGTWGSTTSVANHKDSTHFGGSGVLTVNTGGASTTSLASSPNPSTPVNTVNLTATVTGSGGNGATPSGTVSFLDGASTLGSGTLSGGGLTATASFPASGLTVGTHSLTAKYNGDPNYDLSTSSPVTQTVNAPLAATCPVNKNADATGPGGAAVTFSVGTSGGCSGASATANPPSGSTFPLGTSTVSVTANDSCANSASCSFTVTVYPPLSVTCPADITAAATSPSGAVVTYSDTTSGGCDPSPAVNCNPPSGSTFPIGTTTVTCTATDPCGGSATCSFTVTVTAPTIQSSEYFFVDLLLPPTNVVYIPPALDTLFFPPNIIISNVQHRALTVHLPPPPLGSSQIENLSSELDLDLSTDGGATFQTVSANATVSIRVTHTQDYNGTSFYDTEMLQLDLTIPSGGMTLMIRESPTLQSTGQTTVRPVAGGYMIGSFFDVFTELSLDGGGTWTPANKKHRVKMRKDPRGFPPVPMPTPHLPPPTGKYVSPQQWHALYAQGIVIKDVSHKFFTDSMFPPAPGITNIHVFNSQLDLQVSTDGGNSFQFVRAPSPVQVQVSGADGTGLCDTEMTSLSASFMAGAMSVMLRNSPTEHSLGGTQVTPQPDGTYRIGSFFDIFPEISTDGGISWSGATNGPASVQVAPISPEVPKPNPNLPPLDGNYVSPPQWHALYAQGIVLTNVSHKKLTQTQPPPPPGGR